MSEDHTHDDHGHDHAGMGEGDAEPGYYPTRLRAIEALFIENGVFTLYDVERAIEETYVRSSADGARVVAHAWVDPDFKARLLNDAMSAVAELGYEIPDNMPRLTVVENTDEVHNLVVCTLCSCYPRALLGRPPEWYKSLTYRSPRSRRPTRGNERVRDGCGWRRGSPGAGQLGGYAIPDFAGAAQREAST